MHAPIITMTASSAGEELAGLKNGRCTIGQFGYQRAQKNVMKRQMLGAEKNSTAAWFVSGVQDGMDAVTIVDMSVVTVDFRQLMISVDLGRRLSSYSSSLIVLAIVL